MSRFRVTLIGLFLSAVVSLGSGCSSSSGTISREPRSYLQITGGLGAKALAASIDELPAVNIVPNAKGAKIEIAPGKHRVRIRRDGEIVVDRMILVSDEQTMEVSIP